jgi:hypothetical protein
MVHNRRRRGLLLVVAFSRMAGAIRSNGCVIRDCRIVDIELVEKVDKKVLKAF